MKQCSVRQEDSTDGSPFKSDSISKFQILLSGIYQLLVPVPFPVSSQQGSANEVSARCGSNDGQTH